MGKYTVNKVARNYSDCMKPDQTWRRCRPGWRSSSPEQEAQKRADDLLEASGELVTLFTRKIAGDDIIDHPLPPVQTNYVPALPLNIVWFFDSSADPGTNPTQDLRFSDNKSPILSNPTNDEKRWTIDPVNSNLNKSINNFLPRVIAKRPQEGKINYIYVGNKTQFANLSIRLFSQLISDNVIWEYSRGNGIWMPIPILSTSTPKAQTLQESGRMIFDISFFANWKLDYVNLEQMYWIRARIDDKTEGTAAATMMFTQNIIQSTTIWNHGDDPFYYPQEKCVTIKVNGQIFNRVYDIHQLDYSQESFVIITRDQLSNLCRLDQTNNPECELEPLDSCETDPMAHVKEIGTTDLHETIRLRELAFLYKELMRTRQKASGDAIIVLFTRNLRLDNSTITATYTNLCPCTAYGRMQAVRNPLEPDEDENGNKIELCPLCLGTQFLNGYERYVNPKESDGKILMSFPASAFDMPLEEHGLGTTQELTTAWMSFEPRIFVRDIFIRYDANGNEILRYIVMSRTDSVGRRGVLLHQGMVVAAIDKAKIEYHIPAPDLPLAPTQTEVLQSLGIIEPTTSVTPCDEERLRKGIIHCLPKRTRQSE